MKSFCSLGVSALAVLAATSTARADMTVTLATPGGTVGDIMYFPAKQNSGDTGPVSAQANIDSVGGFHAVFDMSDTAGADNVVSFTLSTNKTITIPSGKQLVVMINTSLSSGTSIVPVPIEYVDGNLCDHTGVDDFNYCLKRTNGTYYYAARMVPTGTTISIRPRTVCNEVLNIQGSAPNGCSTLVSGVAGSSTTSTRLTLKFELYVADPITAANPGTAEETEERQLRFYASAPTMTCSLTSGIYAPSDSAIIVNANKFTLYPGDAANGAPAATAFAVVVQDTAGDGGVSSTNIVNLGANFRTGQAATEIPPFGETAVGGFVNSTSTTRTYYDVGFLLRDAGGVLVSPVTACAINDVETADIEGFLRTGKCFIATAAFRTSEAGPVRMLRSFRDQVLLRHDWGRAFVDAYYAWSPSAADWLVEHSALRYPVLLALVPVQAVAWLCLNPLWLALLASLGASLLLYAIFVMRRRATVAALGILAVLSTWSARAETVQPYIDQLKSQMGADSSSEGSYTEQIKRNLPAASADESYTQWLKTNGKLVGTPAGSEGYSSNEKQRLGGGPASGAIAAVKENRSELELKREGEPTSTIGLRYGFNLTRAIAATDPDDELRPFDEVYGSSYAPDISLFYERQLMRSESWGSFGFFGQLGVSFFQGKGVFALALRDAGANDGSVFSTDSARTKFRFFMVPAIVGAAFRVNLANYVRPYLMAGPAGIFFSEARDDGREGSRGISRALYADFGVAIMLDWISRKSTWAMYEENGFKHYYLNIEYAKLFPLGGRVDFEVSGIFAGLTFDL